LAVTRPVCIVDRALRIRRLGVVVRDPAGQRRDRLGVEAIELMPQEVLEEPCIALASPVSVEGSDKQVRSFELLELRRGASSLQLVNLLRHRGTTHYDGVSLPGRD
jgi:hypothetical protein